MDREIIGIITACFTLAFIAIISLASKVEDYINRQERIRLIHIRKDLEREEEQEIKEKQLAIKSEQLEQDHLALKKYFKKIDILYADYETTVYYYKNLDSRLG